MVREVLLTTALLFMAGCDPFYVHEESYESVQILIKPNAELYYRSSDGFENTVTAEFCSLHRLGGGHIPNTPVEEIKITSNGELIHKIAPDQMLSKIQKRQLYTLLVTKDAISIVREMDPAECLAIYG